MYGTAGTSGSKRPGVVATISLGRPVEPPEVGAFHSGVTASGSSSSDSAGSGECPAGSHGRPATCAPTTSRESASSTTASRSASGSRLLTGCGVAPSFHSATQASTNSTELGSATVTRSPRRTPRCA